jgi:hypothetical protein
MESNFWLHFKLERRFKFLSATTWRVEIWTYRSWRIRWIGRSCFSLSIKIWWNSIRRVEFWIAAWWWWIDGFWIWYWLNLSLTNYWTIKIIIELKLKFFWHWTIDDNLVRISKWLLQLRTGRSICKSFRYKCLIWYKLIRRRFHQWRIIANT